MEIPHSPKLENWSPTIRWLSDISKTLIVTGLRYIWYIYVFIQLPYHKENVTQGQFLRRVLVVWIPSFPRLVALQSLKKISLPYYLWREIRWFHALKWSEMQTASTRTWTWVTNSISFDNNCWVRSVCKLLVLDRNIWNHITVCKQMVID